MKKIVFIIIIIMILGLFYSLGRQVYESLKIGNRLDQEAAELVNLQQKNAELKRKLVEVDSLKFIESQARDKLNMSRVGETVVIISKEELDNVLGMEIEKKLEQIPNWLGWWKLFWK